MSSFSHDINKAQQALYRYLARKKIPKERWNNIESDFLNGFEKGWRQIEGLGHLSNMKIFDRYTNPLEWRDIELDPKFLGEGFGTLVAALEFDFQNFVSFFSYSENLFNLICHALRNKPDFLEMVEKKVQEQDEKLRHLK